MYRHFTDTVTVPGSTSRTMSVSSPVQSGPLRHLFPSTTGRTPSTHLTRPSDSPVTTGPRSVGRGLHPYPGHSPVKTHDTSVRLLVTRPLFPPTPTVSPLLLPPSTRTPRGPHGLTVTSASRLPPSTPLLVSPGPVPTRPSYRTKVSESFVTVSGETRSDPCSRPRDATCSVRRGREDLLKGRT